MGIFRPGKGQRTDGIEAIEDEMWIELRFQHTELSLFEHGFHFQFAHLFLPVVLVKNEQVIIECYQDVVYQLWKNWDNFRGQSKINTWIYRIALNVSINHLNKRKRSIPTVAFDLPLQDRIDPQNRDQQEQLNAIYEQIKSLDLVERGIILLYLEGLNYNEMSEILGFSVTNIGTRLSRIKQKLKAQLKK